ncbi:MAG: HD-GYP domain-containing protein [Burkholderiales bacterium]|nr:HD-GYP domain-containing protein [Burkholderiales bacterium]
MLKKIAIQDLRLGMHLHELCGPWLDHPFWRAKFLLADPADIVKLRESGITECWIDNAKGLDVAPPAAPATPWPVVVSEAPAAPKAAEPAACSMNEELSRAAQLVKKSRTAVLSLFSEARMGKTMNSEQCAELVGEITESVWRNPGALVSLARLKTHDDYSYMHSVAVCALMVSLARQLGQGEAEARDAGMAGLLHDMGKALMPLDVLNKPGKLTEAEFDLIKTHPVRGHELLLGGSATAVALDVCLHHHERPDGKGYPHGLSGPALSLQARMGGVCDVYDAITSNRPYKAGWDPAESIARMAEWTQQGQFDPLVVHAFVSSLGIYPTGSLVRLKSGRLAVVVEQNPAALASPKVKVFFSTKAQMPLPPELVDLNHPGCSERISGRESNAVWQFKHLDELWAGREALDKARRTGSQKP